MRVTLTLIGDRVANGGDYIALGERSHKTPGWRHLFVDFDVKPYGVQTRWVGDMETGQSAAADLSVAAMNAIARHCAAYPNVHAAIFLAAAQRQALAQAKQEHPNAEA